MKPTITLKAVHTDYVIELVRLAIYKTGGDDDDFETFYQNAIATTREHMWDAVRKVAIISNEEMIPASER